MTESRDGEGKAVTSYNTFLGQLICDFNEDLDCDSGGVIFQTPTEGKYPTNYFTQIYFINPIQEPHLMCGVVVTHHK